MNEQRSGRLASHFKNQFQFFINALHTNLLLRFEEQINPRAGDRKVIVKLASECTVDLQGRTAESYNRKFCLVKNVPLDVFVCTLLFLTYY